MKYDFVGDSVTIYMRGSSDVHCRLGSVELIIQVPQSLDGPGIKQGQNVLQLQKIVFLKVFENPLTLFFKNLKTFTHKYKKTLKIKIQMTVRLIFFECAALFNPTMFVFIQKSF